MPGETESGIRRPEPSDASVLEVGGALTSAPSERMVRTAFQQELDHQRGLMQEAGLVDIAHTQVMVEAGVIPAAAGGDLLRALVELQQGAEDFKPVASRGDLYTNREYWLRQHCAAAGWLGIGRARREVITTAWLMRVRAALIELADCLVRAGCGLKARVREHSASMMPDYTYLQAAQPTTFGHYLLGFVFPIMRDLQRLRQLYDRVNRCSAGCGSSNGSRIPQNRVRLSALLGFDSLVEHARDAVWQADIPIESAALLAAIMVNCDRLVEDLQVFCSAEFGLIEFDERHARASKIMPQKKNPFACTHIRGVCKRVAGTLATVTALGTGTSGQPDSRLPIYGLIPDSIAEVSDNLLLLEEMVHLLRFNRENGVQLAGQSFVMAAELAECLVVNGGLDFRTAHRLVAGLVREYESRGCFAGLDATALAETAQRVLGRSVVIPDQELAAALDMQAAIDARGEPGGVAPAAIEAMLMQLEAEFAANRRWLESRRCHLQRAQDRLLQSAIDTPGSALQRNRGEVKE